MKNLFLGLKGFMTEHGAWFSGYLMVLAFVANAILTESVK